MKSSSTDFVSLIEGVKEDKVGNYTPLLESINDDLRKKVKDSQHFILNRLLSYFEEDKGLIDFITIVARDLGKAMNKKSPNGCEYRVYPEIDFHSNLMFVSVKVREVAPDGMVWYRGKLYRDDDEKFLFEKRNGVSKEKKIDSFGVMLKGSNEFDKAFSNVKFIKILDGGQFLETEVESIGQAIVFTYRYLTNKYQGLNPDMKNVDDQTLIVRISGDKSDGAFRIGTSKNSSDHLTVKM